MDPVEIFRGHHISNFEKKIREITDYVHWAAAAIIIVLGLVAYLVVIGCTSKHVLIPSFTTLTPNPLDTIIANGSLHQKKTAKFQKYGNCQTPT